MSDMIICNECLPNPPHNMMRVPSSGNNVPYYGEHYKDGLAIMTAQAVISTRWYCDDECDICGSVGRWSTAWG